jgi:hypothetical protein
MSAILYFAYGSNMCTGRLRFRVPHCRPTTIARLTGYRLRFHKRSADGSGKCNILRTDIPEDAVFGVVFEFPANEKEALDRAEGLGQGYDEEELSVVSPDGARLDAVYAYVADPTAIDDHLKPYSWYKEFVLSGAEEHWLPSDYVETHIRAVVAVPDPDRRRDARRRAETR